MKRFGLILVSSALAVAGCYHGASRSNNMGGGPGTQSSSGMQNQGYEEQGTSGGQSGMSGSSQQTPSSGMQNGQQQWSPNSSSSDWQNQQQGTVNTTTPSTTPSGY